jgi:hypothetical protein
MGAARGKVCDNTKQIYFLHSTGIDEGLISGTLAKTHFAHKLGLDKMSTTELANVKGNISAMVQIGSVGGAAL